MGVIHNGYSPRVCDMFMFCIAFVVLIISSNHTYIFVKIKVGTKYAYKLVNNATNWCYLDQISIKLKWTIQ